jgi:hypothetical protein
LISVEFTVHQADAPWASMSWWTKIGAPEQQQMTTMDVR